MIMKHEHETSASVMSLKEWVITLIITCIPGLRLIMLLVWAFGNSATNANKRNWAKATLLIELICIILVVLVYAILIAFAVIVRN
jgi:signal transduction histidine kinase